MDPATPHHLPAGQPSASPLQFTSLARVTPAWDSPVIRGGMSHERDSLCIGLDLGGTKLAGALVASDGSIVESTRKLSRPEEGAEQVLGVIVEAVEELVAAAAGKPVLGVGIGVAGQVDPET